jgi:F-type H+-transporting ATPase subunit gamma
MTSRASGVTPLARRIAGEIAESRSVRIVHATPRKGAAYEVETRRILPLEPGGDDPWVAPPLHHLSAAELLAALAVERVFADIAHALMESLAAESAARLMTMDAASHNIEDRLDRLRRDAREVRQERLTAEMLDVVTGAEAVEGD